MLQALLALSLIIVFMPIIVRQMAVRGMDTQMNATTEQVNSIVGPLRAFVSENADRFMYDTEIISVSALEPYGLPIGLRPRTPFGGQISIITSRSTDDYINAFIIIGRGNMRAIDRAELALRIGFWGGLVDGTVVRGATGGWEIDMAEMNFQPLYDTVFVRVPYMTDTSDLLQLRTLRPENNQMNTDINMGGHDIRGARNITTFEGRFRSATTADMIISGDEDGRRARNRFGNLNIRRAVFTAPGGMGALNISRGTLSAESLTAPSVSAWGDPGMLDADTIYVHSLAIAAGRTGFSGPHIWNINQNAIFQNMAITAEHIEVAGSINASRGQDIFTDEYDDGMILFTQRSGIETDIISASAITLRDQTSSGILAGISGRTLIDIRLSGVSVLPDVQIN